MNTFPAYRVQLYIENDWQVRDERAAHSVIKLLANSPHYHPRLDTLNTGSIPKQLRDARFSEVDWV
ncbi:hypothetical protein L3V31_13130 [Vibrio sp. J1-1]|uniref:hypothetical protein n=1 Tax=Vibrio sp. J1-1 TaxID=2912251 RepID=UPI001F436B68|nr:hypothetical protein [Vibrio sp. J1-1]MCF7482673.1 hypothetical protein [Vibrio sp. J1-1]